MVRWKDFAAASPELARIGASLLLHPDRGEVAILAMANADHRPCVAPVSPIACNSGLYLSVGSHTPKVHHLLGNGYYALHAMVGADDLEFQISGSVRNVVSQSERDEVVAAIPFPSFDRNDPIFELLIERALVVTWPERTTKGLKQSWRADS